MEREQLQTALLSSSRKLLQTSRLWERGQMYSCYLRAMGLGMMDFPLTLIWHGPLTLAQTSRPEAPKPHHLGFCQKKHQNLLQSHAGYPVCEPWLLGSGHLAPASFFKIYSSHHRSCTNSKCTFEWFQSRIRGLVV